MNAKQNYLFWICGFPGAGKSTLAKQLVNALSETRNTPVYLDGDQLREIWGEDIGYSLEDRLKNAQRIAAMSKLIYKQGHDVVVATVSLFNQVRDSLRDSVPGYKEIYVRVTEDTLRLRNQKNLYLGSSSISQDNDSSNSGEKPLVPGVNQFYELPTCPHLVIDNDENSSSFKEPVEKMLALIKGV